MLGSSCSGVNVATTWITHMQLKSYIARIAHEGTGYKVLGVVLNDGTPIRSVEVRVDDAPWQPAARQGSTRSCRARSTSPERVKRS